MKKYVKVLLVLYTIQFFMSIVFAFCNVLFGGMIGVYYCGYNFLILLIILCGIMCYQFITLIFEEY